MPLISIVLPSYNGEKFISRAIESCLTQTFSDFELIIVNDCSTDSTLSIAKKYCEVDPRVRIINNEVNLNLPNSLNIGFDAAQGDYLTWTSDDNYFAPNALEVLSKVLVENRNADIVYSSYCFIDEHGKILEPYGDYPENLLFNCIIGACFLYRKKVHIELGGYDVSKYRMEDMDFWLRATSKFRYHFVDQNDLYYYRKHSNSLTSEIYKNAVVLAEYRSNYKKAFEWFFNECLQAGFSEKELEIHLKIFFEDLLNVQSFEFDISNELISCLNHLDSLSKSDWNLVSFDKQRVLAILSEKKNRIVKVVVNNLVFSNKVLAEKNPALASQLDKPISWYYQEYEVLPRWYKRVGHFIKILQGNKVMPSIALGLFKR